MQRRLRRRRWGVTNTRKRQYCTVVGCGRAEAPGRACLTLAVVLYLPWCRHAGVTRVIFAALRPLSAPGPSPRHRLSKIMEVAHNSATSPGCPSPRSGRSPADDSDYPLPVFSPIARRGLVGNLPTSWFAPAQLAACRRPLAPRYSHCC